MIVIASTVSTERGNLFNRDCFVVRLSANSSQWRLEFDYWSLVIYCWNLVIGI